MCINVVHVRIPQLGSHVRPYVQCIIIVYFVCLRRMSHGGSNIRQYKDDDKSIVSRLSRPCMRD